MKRWTSGALGWGVMLLAGCGPVERAAGPPVAVQVQQAERAEAQADASRSLTYMAVVKPHQEWTASFKAGGIIEQIGGADGEDWREGVDVARGTLLARLTRADFQNNLKAAESRLQLAQEEYQRRKDLYDSKSISVQELDTVESALKSATALFDVARQALEEAEIKAPFDGTIMSRLARSGETVSPGQPVLRFGDLSRMIFEVGVPDTVVGGVHTGQTFSATIPALDDRVRPATVTEVGVAAQPDTRLFRVVLEVDNAEFAVRGGMTAYVNFAAARAASSDVVIPISAVFLVPTPAGANRTAAFVVSAGSQAEQRFIETGDIVANRVVVKAGIEAGESVVVVGVHAIHDGSPLRAEPVAENIY